MRSFFSKGRGGVGGEIINAATTAVFFYFELFHLSAAQSKVIDGVGSFVTF